jgi:hypothetical protein
LTVQIAELRKILAHIRCRARFDQVLAVVVGNHGAKRALILCVRLAEIEVWHSTVIIGRYAENFNGTSGL